MTPNESHRHWFMLTLVGADRPGIVARVTGALYRGGCNLGEASMLRLGGVFTIMLMVSGTRDAEALAALVEPVAAELSLHVHVDEVQARLHAHPRPDVQITVYGADRPGIVAEVTGALAEAGLNILDLNSQVGGTAERPVYIMLIDGHAAQGVDKLERALARVREQGIDASLRPLDTLIG